MAKNESELDQLIAELGITAKVVESDKPAPKDMPTGSRSWRVVFKRDVRGGEYAGADHGGAIVRMTTSFYTGPAHTRPPTCADVLSCTASDARAGEQTFEEFCSDMGYSTDSRKAHATWAACAKIATKLRAFFGEHFDEVTGAEHGGSRDEKEEPGMRTTAWAILGEGAKRTRARATYGWEMIKGNRAPYFAVTGEVQRVVEREGKPDLWREESSGACHEAIVLHHPDLAPLVRWHCCFPDEPAHEANGLYFWELAATGKCGNLEPRPEDADREKNARHFASVVKLGAVHWDLDLGKPVTQTAKIHTDGFMRRYPIECATVRVVTDRPETPGAEARGVYVRIGESETLLATKEGCRRFLAERVPALLAAMKRDMAAAGIVVPEVTPETAK